MRVHVYARDDDLNLAGRLDDLIATEAKVLHQGTGAWIVSAPLDGLTDELFAQLLPDAALDHTHVGVEVWVDEFRFASGPVERVVRDQGMGVLTLYGVTDEVWIRDRLVSPDPADATFPTFAVDYDVRTDQASTVMYEFADVNAGPGALAARQVPDLTLAADPTEGGTITESGRWHRNLEELLRSAGVASGSDLGWRVLPDDLGGLVFSITVPVDRSASVVFTTTGEAGPSPSAALVVERRRRSVSSVIVGGQGEGAARVFRNRTIAGPVRERFVDRRDTADNDELDQAGDELLAESAASGTVTVDVARSPFRLGVDYSLGDLVTVDTPYGDIAGIVRQLALRTEDGDVELRPVIGPPGVTDPLQFTSPDATDRRLSLEGV